MRCNDLQSKENEKTQVPPKKKNMNRNMTKIKVSLKTQPTKGKQYHKQHHEQ